MSPALQIHQRLKSFPQSVFLTQYTSLQPLAAYFFLSSLRPEPILLKKVTSHTINHLGNVLSVVTDNKISESGHNNGEELLFLYRPEVVSYSEYYPFGE